ncbi:hypothetical protein FGG12_15450 [Cupriavidus campinensis]|uniref:LysR substrate-binding domain-containing protein n=1 Tax=Cupriavidus campinensis TaxID=151783 RepID=A0ABY3ELU5_9BURK|nr:hypothetical protein FGG12_15450 [Cupriavidus campinensis]
MLHGGTGLSTPTPGLLWLETAPLRHRAELAGLCLQEALRVSHRAGLGHFRTGRLQTADHLRVLQRFDERLVQPCHHGLWRALLDHDAGPEGRPDFAIAIADPDDLPPELAFEPLFEVSAVPAGRTGHPLAGATDWQALEHARWTLNLSPGSQSETLLEWLRTSDLPVPRQITACTSPTLMTELMRRTDAIGYCPTQLLTDPMYGNGLQACAALSPLPPPMLVGLIGLRAMPLGASARMLAELFVGYLAP